MRTCPLDKCFVQWIFYMEQLQWEVRISIHALSATNAHPEMSGVSE